VVKSRDLVPYNLAVQGIRSSLSAWNPMVQVEETELPTSLEAEESFLRGLRETRPDLILTVGTQATRAVARRIRDTPIVFSLVLASGEPQDGVFLNRPANVTGAAMDVPIETQFERLKEVVPHLRRVGVMFNPRETGRTVESAREAARGAGLQLVPIAVSNEAQVLREMETLKGSVDVLLSVADSTVFTTRSVDVILLTTIRDGIPFIGLSPSFVKAGALLAFSCDYRDVGVQAGELGVAVLSGTPPRELPIAYPRQISLYLNLNTARAIRLEISEKIRAESLIHFRP
jgi:putative ABC transport system substrate-binding protein